MPRSLKVWMPGPELKKPGGHETARLLTWPLGRRSGRTAAETFFALQPLAVVAWRISAGTTADAVGPFENRNRVGPKPFGFSGGLAMRTAHSSASLHFSRVAVVTHTPPHTPNPPSPASESPAARHRTSDRNPLVHRGGSRAPPSRTFAGSRTRTLGRR